MAGIIRALTQRHERKEGPTPVHRQEYLRPRQQVNLDYYARPQQFGPRRTQLMPITRPRLFQISPYGGSKPTASRTEATIPTTITGVSFPALYSGYNVFVSVSAAPSAPL